MKNLDDLIALFGEHWFTRTGSEDQQVVASRVRLARNVASTPFPHRMGKQIGARLLAKTERYFRNLKPELAGSFSMIDPYGRDSGRADAFQEKCLIPSGFNGPLNRLFLSQDGRTGVLVNRTDHFRLFSMSPGLGLLERLDHLHALDEAMEREFKWAVSIEWGYLSSQLSNLGTAMSASVLLHLPALAQSVEFEALARAVEGAVDSEGAGLRSFQEGSIFDETGMFILGNTETLGRSETEQVNKLDEIAKLLLHYERSAAAALRGRDTAEFDDESFRALGILRSCRRIELEEMVRLLSRVRVGISAETLLDSELQPLVEAWRLNSLLFLGQEGVVSELGPVLRTLGSCESPEEARATLVRTVLDSEEIVLRPEAEGDTVVKK